MVTVQQRCDSFQEAFQAIGTTGVLCGAIAVRQACKSVQKAHIARSLHGCHRPTCVRKRASEVQQPCDFEGKCVPALVVVITCTAHTDNKLINWSATLQLHVIIQVVGRFSARQYTRMPGS